MTTTTTQPTVMDAVYGLWLVVLLFLERVLLCYDSAGARACGCRQGCLSRPLWLGYSYICSHVAVSSCTFRRLMTPSLEIYFVSVAPSYHALFICFLFVFYLFFAYMLLSFCLFCMRVLFLPSSVHVLRMLPPHRMMTDGYIRRAPSS